MKLERYKDFDWILIGAVFLLSFFGIIMVYSASYPLGIDLADDPAYFFKRQLVWFIVGALLFLVVMHFPYRMYRKLTPFIITASIIMLVLVLLVGLEINGAQRWLGVGGFRIQPSEFVKLGIVIYLAQVYSQKQQYINLFIKGVIPPLVVVVFIFTLIMLQPDLGTATAILLVTVIIVFLSGARFRHLAVLGGLSAVVVAWLAFQAPYRVQRLVAFRDPFEFASDAGGYQLVQSYIAIAHGGITGTGLGQSVQKLHYLPEPHTDFILAVIAEELGMLGVGFLLICLLVIAVRGLMIGIRCKNTFGTLLALGIIFQMMSQAIFNGGAVTGLLPITGITLPFISYGGSSLLVSLVAAGILANISRENSKEKRLAEQEPAHYSKKPHQAKAHHL
ncbi:putative lipid II flippase FtsW [Bacillus sp. FJAT-44742]|uniref:putative lipid II flippase FtsW n=1 Tax=Bacillus sp. FJAT-44742 TaxID=2014005 RepID=UPI000C230AA3|nr:putative lipid II flippase FtsW [Bacillus sp. FJAT-44742]